LGKCAKKKFFKDERKARVQLIKMNNIYFRFASIINNSCPLINKNFKVSLKGNFWNNRNHVLEVLQLNRNINEFELADINGHHNVLTAIFQRHGWHLTKLRISNSKIDDYSFRELLKSCINLKEITLSEVEIVKKLPAINPVAMASLKNLTILYCNWVVFKFFYRTLINSLTVKNYFDEGKNRKYLVDFLERQYQLKDFTIHATALKALFLQNDFIDNCSFSLQNFSIDTVGKNSDQTNFNLKLFLSLHADTLKSFEIIGPHNQEIIAFVLINFNNLEELSLDVRGLPKNHEFYEALENDEKNLMLKNLKLCGFFFQIEFVKIVLMKFPAIKNLEINDWSKSSSTNILNFVSNKLLQLEQLTITEISNAETNKFQSKLKKLTVHYIQNMYNLADFIAKNDTVEDLNVNLIYIGQINNLINDVRQLDNVKHLSVGGSKTALQKIVNLIKYEQQWLKLKTLKLSLVNEEKLSSTADYKAIKFNLPFDPIDLNLKCNVLL
jgi:hypothetical protein